MPHREPPPRGSQQRHRSILTLGHLSRQRPCCTIPKQVRLNIHDKFSAPNHHYAHQGVPRRCDDDRQRRRELYENLHLPPHYPPVSQRVCMCSSRINHSMNPSSRWPCHSGKSIYFSLMSDANLHPAASPASSSSARSTRSPAQLPASPVRSPARAILSPPRAHTMTSLVPRRWHTMFPAPTRATPGRSKRHVPLRAPFRGAWRTWADVS